VQKTLANVNQTTAAAAPAAADLRRVLRKLDAIISSQDADIESIISSLRRVSEQAAALVEDAKNNPSRVIFGEPPPHVVQTGAAK